MNGYFDSGTAKVGGKDVAFEKRKVRGDILMYVPCSFFEDKSIVSNYSYLFSKDKSPLSVAVKYSAYTAASDRQKIIQKYFSHSPEEQPTDIVTDEYGVVYRETVISSRYMNVYSLRFAVEAEGGLLLGCFNCAADYRNDWKPVVLEMLHNIEKA